MAQPDSSTNTPKACTSCDCGPALAFLLARVLLGLMLLLAGVEKFKSPNSPYTYSRANWHDVTNEAGEVITPGRWMSVAKPVFEFGGFNNKAVWGEDEKITKTFSYMFYGYAQVLPYAMIVVGLFILAGLFTRIALFIGGGIWMTMAAGQMTLPDNPTVFMLSVYTMFYVVALALTKHDFFSLGRLIRGK